MYRTFISEAERKRIIDEYSDPKTPPHCDDRMFHEPGICAFCDGYYHQNPAFKPASYVTPEANGWGGNQAPIVNDEKAAEEDAAWNKALGAIEG
jgi:hypothetical protein